MARIVWIDAIGSSGCGVQVSVLSYGSWVSFHNQVDVKQVRPDVQAGFCLLTGGSAACT